MPRKTLAQRLDDSVRWTGVPTVAEGGVRRRRMRVLPALVLLLAAGGFALSIARTDRVWSGYTVVMVAFALSAWMPIFGPIRPWSDMRLVDERERLVRVRAYMVAFAIAAYGAMIGIWLLAGFDIFDPLPTGTRNLLLIQFAFVLACVVNAVPTLHASLTLAAPPPEED